MAETQQSPDTAYTNPTIILIVVSSLAAFTFIGFVGVILMCFWKLEGSSIAIVSSLTGASLGYLASLLSSTKTMQGGLERRERRRELEERQEKLKQTTV